VAGAVLAAGSGTRMGTPKSELIVDGVRLLDRAVDALRKAGCDPVIAVVREQTHRVDGQLVVNSEPERGMRSSLALAVAAAAEHDALAVILVDVPGIGADAIRTVIDAWQPGRIAIGRIGTRRTHPTVMADALWVEALQHAGPDEGARALMAERGDLIDEVDVQGNADDLDTPEDLEHWQRRND
jgi:CTP:molybdopterin cytidylyltransferase MocA